MKLENNQIKEDELERVEEAVFVIDMINGFVKFGPLAAPSIMRVVPFQQEILEESENKPNSINVFGDDEHGNNAREFLAYGPHANNKEEIKVISELERYKASGLEFKKNCTNLMLAPGVIQLLEKLKNLKKVYIMGCLSEVCVSRFTYTINEYFDQTNRDVEVCVYANGIDTYDAPDHNADEVTNEVLKKMESEEKEAEKKGANRIKVLRRKRKINKKGDGIYE